MISPGNCKDCGTEIDTLKGTRIPDAVARARMAELIPIERA